MEFAAPRLRGEALAVMFGHLREGVQRAAGDLSRLEGLLGEAEDDFEAHADFFYNIRNLWDSFRSHEVVQIPSQTHTTIVSPTLQAAFIAGVDACLPQLRPDAPDAALPLPVLVSSFLGSHTWDGMYEVVSNALDFIKEQAMVDFMSA